MVAEEDALLAPGMTVANELILLPAQRMEWMSYTKSLRIAATAGS